MGVPVGAPVGGDELKERTKERAMPLLLPPSLSLCCQAVQGVAPLVVHCLDSVLNYQLEHSPLTERVSINYWRSSYCYFAVPCPILSDLIFDSFTFSLYNIMEDAAPNDLTNWRIIISSSRFVCGS